MTDEQPVAWMYRRPNLAYPGRFPDHTVVTDMRWGENDWDRTQGWTETPLYTRPNTPPAVSDEVLVERLRDEIDAWAGDMVWSEELARAILPIIREHLK